MEHVRHIKAHSRALIFRDLMNVLLSSVILFGVLLLLEELYMRLTGLHQMARDMETAVLNNDFEAFQKVTIPDMPVASRIIGAVVYLLTIVVELGYEGYALRRARGETPKAWDILPKARFFLRIYAIWLLKAVIVGVGLSLFIVPGVYLFYGYRQAVYIMFDNPELSAIECMRRSRLMMKGRRVQLFLHDIAFILWDLICVIFSPAAVWVTPYKAIAHALFYTEISGTEPVIEVEDSDIE